MYFARDKRESMPIASNIDHEVQQKDLGSIISWFKRNNLEHREHKFKLMIRKSHIRRSSAFFCDDKKPFWNQLHAYQVSHHITLSSSYELRCIGVLIAAEG